ncbi:MAG: 3-oxoacyl-[acyl-carrier-protein] synthase II [Planctomycetota bacterium]|jgi:3-oxoacyl-[acyl-carrier-protein] synthase II
MPPASQTDTPSAQSHDLHGVVVTGLGAVTPFGWDLKCLMDGLLLNERAIDEMQLLDPAGHRTSIAGEVRDDAEALRSGVFEGMKTRQFARLARTDRFALAATHEALGQARLERRDLVSLGSRVGLFFGSSTGAMHEGEQFFAELVKDPMASARRETISPGRLSTQQNDGPGNTVARHFGVGGPHLTFATACAAATMAIEAAWLAFAADEIDVAIVGGSDGLCHLTYAGFNSLRAVSANPCQPFRAERDGLTIGEGAGVLILERAGQARKRGAPALARLLSASSSCDAHHMTAPHPEGLGIGRAIERALDLAGAQPADVSFVNAHGTGTPHNDGAEAVAFRAVFGDGLAKLPVTSTKGAIGHLLGSAGAVEAVVTVRTLQLSSVHPTPGLPSVDPAQPLDLVRGRARALENTNIGLSTNLAFGGANAALLFGVCSGAEMPSSKVVDGPKPTPSVVITGLGLVGPFGVGAEALGEALAQGQVPQQDTDRSRGFHLGGSAQTAGLLDQTQLKGWLDPRSSRRMSLPSKLAVAAARMALDDAGLERQALAGRDAAVVLGTAFGPTAFSLRILDQLHKGGPESVSPFLFMESVANVHAGQVALDNGLVGPNATIAQHEAGTLLAVAQAQTYLASGAASLALAGGVEEMAPITHAILDRFGALSRGTGGDPEQGRPFDRNRDGFLASEGSVVVVLENEAVAQARGARILARLRGSVRASDATASAQSWGHDHEGLARALRGGLARQGIDVKSIDRVVSGANGSAKGDLLEARVLREVFGADLPPVVVPKSVTGEYGAGLLGAAVLAVGNETAWPTPGFEVIDPDCCLRPHDGRALAPAQRVLVSCLSAAGSACWLVLDAPGIAEGAQDQGGANA